MRHTMRRVNRILKPKSDVPTFTESRHECGGSEARRFVGQAPYRTSEPGPLSNQWFAGVLIDSEVRAQRIHTVTDFRIGTLAFKGFW